jgi:hypothetical protein
MKGRVLDWLSGALVLSGLWMIDELLTLARYCGKDCSYSIPLIGPVGQYAAEGIAWIMILGGIGLLFRRDNER